MVRNRGQAFFKISTNVEQLFLSFYKCIIKLTEGDLLSTLVSTYCPSAIWCQQSDALTVTTFFKTMTIWSCCQYCFNNRTALSRKGI